MTPSIAAIPPAVCRYRRLSMPTRSAASAPCASAARTIARSRAVGARGTNSPLDTSPGRNGNGAAPLRWAASLGS